MIELRFHHELYDGFAVDEAVKAYADFASTHKERDPNGYIVRLTALAAAAEQGIDERAIAAELMNYALGKTIERATAGNEIAGSEGAAGNAGNETAGAAKAAEAKEARS